MSRQVIAAAKQREQGVDCSVHIAPFLCSNGLIIRFSVSQARGHNKMQETSLKKLLRRVIFNVTTNHTVCKIDR